LLGTTERMRGNGMGEGGACPAVCCISAAYLAPAKCLHAVLLPTGNVCGSGHFIITPDWITLLMHYAVLSTQAARTSLFFIYFLFLKNVSSVFNIASISFFNYEYKEI